MTLRYWVTREGNKKFAIDFNGYFHLTREEINDEIERIGLTHHAYDVTTVVNGFLKEAQDLGIINPVRTKVRGLPTELK